MKKCCNGAGCAQRTGIQLPRGWGRQRLLAAPPNPAAASTPSPPPPHPPGAWGCLAASPCGSWHRGRAMCTAVLLCAPPPTHTFDLGARTCLGTGWSCLYSAFLLQLRTQRLLHLCLLLAPLQGWNRPCQQGNLTPCPQHPAEVPDAARGKSRPQDTLLLLRVLACRRGGCSV